MQKARSLAGYDSNPQLSTGHRIWHRHLITSGPGPQKKKDRQCSQRPIHSAAWSQLHLRSSREPPPCRLGQATKRSPAGHAEHKRSTRARQPRNQGLHGGGTDVGPGGWARVWVLLSSSSQASTSSASWPLRNPYKTHQEPDEHHGCAAEIRIIEVDIKDKASPDRPCDAAQAHE